MRRNSGLALALAALLITLASCNSTPSEPIPVPGNATLSGRVSLVARDGTRMPGAGVGLWVWQCSPGTNPGGETGMCEEVMTGNSTADAQGAYSFLGLYAIGARIWTFPPAEYLPLEIDPNLVQGPNVLNIDLHQK